MWLVNQLQNSQRRKHNDAGNNLHKDISFEVTPELSFKDNLGADSVDMMEFILTLEDEFGIDILDEDIDRLCSVADVVAYIEKKTK